MNMTDIYVRYTMGKQVDESLIRTSWGDVARNFQELKHLVTKKKHLDPEKIENIYQFKNILTKHMKNIGVIDHPILEKIEILASKEDHDFLGIFEIGHQPLLFGGGFFITGKVSLLDYLTRKIEEETKMSVLPIFFIGGHDRLHNEIITARFPQHNSASGLFLKFPTIDEEEQLEPPIFRLRKPPRSWLELALEKIEGNFTQLIKHSASPENRPLLLERVHHLIRVFRATWSQATNYLDWIEKVWRDVYLFHCNLDLSIMSVTDPSFNGFLLPAYEWLLKEEIRKQFVGVFNDVTQKIEQAGIKPALPYRNPDFVPFYLQCPDCELHPRLQPRIIKPGLLEAICESCKELGKEPLTIEYNPSSPDLHDYQEWLLPRAESRTLSFCYLLPETVHIGGSGETAYHAQLFPIYRKLGVEPPIFVKTYRLFYTTPWTEKTNHLLSRQLDTSFLPNKEFFKLIRKIRKAKDTNKLMELQDELERKLQANFKEIVTLEETLNNKIQQEDSNSDFLKRQLNLVKIYASHFYGRYAPEQAKPDVSWNWSSIAILVGIHDLTYFIQRNINPRLPIGTTAFLSPGTF